VNKALKEARAAASRAEELEREAVIASLSKTPPMSETSIAESLGITRYRVREIRLSLGLPARGEAGRKAGPKPLGKAARTILTEALAGVDSASSAEERARRVRLLESAVRLVLEEGSAD